MAARITRTVLKLEANSRLYVKVDESLLLLQSTGDVAERAANSVSNLMHWCWCPPPEQKQK